MAPPDKMDFDAQKGEVAGQKLLALCTKVISRSRDWISAFEEAMLDECCAAGPDADRVAFTRSATQSLRLSLEASRYKLVLKILRKLKGAVSTTFLKDEPDILPSAAASCFAGRTTWQLGYTISGELIDVLQLLIEHGADVRAFDKHGNTALFYSCMLGHYELFRKLLGEGADISTTHDFVSWRKVTSLNLLQATLEAFLWKEIERPWIRDYPWKLKLGDEWTQIASYLLDAGLACPREDPRLVKLLQTACFQGNGSWIKRLIEYGVPIDTTTVREYSGGRFYACSLHAAAAGGQADVVQLLLDRGARPQDTGLSTCVELDREAPRSPGEHPPRKTRQQTALAVAVDETRAHAMKDFRVNRQRGGVKDSELEQLISNYWKTCRVLVEMDSDPANRDQLLELSAKHGEVSLVKRLLQMGSRLVRVPDTKSFETIQLLVQHGSEFDAAQAQKSAIEQGECGLLNRLFQRWGNLVPSDGFEQLFVPLISEGDMQMLDLLVSNYVHDINEVFRVRSDNNEKGREARRNSRKLRQSLLSPVGQNQYESHETLLQIACRSGSKATIEFFLERGANLHCPETDNNALTTLEKRLKSQRVPTSRLWELWSLVQLLERHMPETGQKMRAQWRVKAQRRASIDIVVNNKYEAVHYSESSASPSSRLPLPMEKIEVEDFEYAPLHGRDAIRTMKLHPATDSSTPIECELILSDLSVKPDYDALSYVWGDKSVPRYIKLDSKVFQVTSNLYEALLALRVGSNPRCLWVDAICINQRDIIERNQQVTLMGDIYMNANKVFVWLGQAGEDSNLVFQHLADFRQHQDDVLSGRVRPRDPFDESHVNPPHYLGPTRAAFERLCQRPWFFRTWAIQEKALSKEAIVCCGSDSASWEEFFRPIGYKDEAYHPLLGLDFRSRGHQVHKLRPSTASGAYQKVLTYSQFCQATDPKDRVYSILGLLRPGLIKVEYELDVQEVYRKFAQVIIQDDGGIGLLNLYGIKHTLPGLPSWVPDFSTNRPSCPLPTLSGSFSMERWQWLDKYLTKALPGLRVRNGGKELIIKGKAVDTIRAIGDEMCASKEYALGTEAYSRTLSGWESLAASIGSMKNSEMDWTSGDSLNTVSEAFLATLVAFDTVLDRNSWSRIGGIVWYKQHGTGALVEKEPRYFEDVAYCTDLAYGDKGTEDGSRHEYQLGYRRYVKDSERTIYGRKLFVTEGGLLGLADPLVKAGDKIVFLTGSTYPFALRPYEGDAFTVLGDCYVYGLDVLNLFDDADKPVVEYVLS